MAVSAICLVTFLAMAGYSSAGYCVCNSAADNSTLQKNIDYACGNGADCSQLKQNAPCFNPNSLKDHCNYAVNSYYQKKGQISGSCEFSGSASVVQTAPTGQSSTCVYPSSASTSTTPLTGGSTSIGGATGGAGGTTTGNSTGINPTFGGNLGPSPAFGMNNNNSSTRVLYQSGNTFISLILPLLFSCLVWPKLQGI